MDTEVKDTEVKETAVSLMESLVVTRSYLIKPSDKPLKLQDKDAKKYRLKSLDELKKKLAATKAQLDVLFKKPMFPSYWKEFDPFKDERMIAVKLSNSYNISNAWLKCYEMIEFYKMLPETISTPTFMHFDNAAFPGSFILAVYHYVKTLRPWANKHIWRGSSLVTVNEQNSSPLEDKYGLFEGYKSNWLMNTNNNGDVLLESNQRDFQRQVGGKVDLYTSDLGFDVSSDYNNQELIHAYANIGQILSALVTLKKGGSMITKQYSYFEPITVSVIYATSTFFEKFHICKPYTSREANSEVYLVGIGFKHPSDDIFEHPYVKEMFARVSKKVPLEVPLFDAKDYPKEFIKTIVSSSTEIYTSQIDKINADIDRISEAMRSGYRGHVSQSPIVLKFREQEEPKIEAWYHANPILPIESQKMLKMKNALKQ